MFKRNLLKVYVLLWFVTGCKISYNTYDFDKSPEIEKPNYSDKDSLGRLYLELSQMKVLYLILMKIKKKLMSFIFTQL